MRLSAVGLLRLIFENRLVIEPSQGTGNSLLFEDISIIFTLSRTDLFGEFSGNGQSVKLEYLLTGEMGCSETLLELDWGQSTLG